MSHRIGDTRLSLPGLLKVGPHSEEGARVTTFELFFDLVFVFSFTQVSALMATAHVAGYGALGVVQGVTVLSMLWGVWVSFGWLANQTRADRGLVRVGFIAAAVTVFTLALVIPSSFPVLGEAKGSAFVLVACYVVARLIHATVYVKAAGDDIALRRQVLITACTSLPPAGALLFFGAAVGAPWQTALWLLAFAVDAVIVYITSAHGEWRVHSASHWTERYGLIIMLGLGESVVAIGVGAAQSEFSVPLVAGATLAVGLAFALWWAYFERMEPAAEPIMARAKGQERARLATDAFTYLHLVLLAGIILTALGIEVAIRHVTEFEHGFGWFGAIALAGGLALYFAGTGFYWRRMAGWWPWTRMGSGVLLLASIPILASLSALVSLTVITALVAVLLFVEELLDRWWRARAGGAMMSTRGTESVSETPPTH